MRDGAEAFMKKNKLWKGGTARDSQDFQVATLNVNVVGLERDWIRSWICGIADYSDDPRETRCQEDSRRCASCNRHARYRKL